MSMNHPECQICQQADAESSIAGYDVCPDCYEDIRGEDLVEECIEMNYR